MALRIRSSPVCAPASKPPSGVDLHTLTPSASCGFPAPRRSDMSRRARPSDQLDGAGRGARLLRTPRRARRPARVLRLYPTQVFFISRDDPLLLLDGPRYGGSTTVASLEDGLAYPNPNQDFDNSTTRRQDRGSRAPLAGDNRIGSPPCSATRWAYRMRDASDAIT